jgi:hypothetical protein
MAVSVPNLRYLLLLLSYLHVQVAAQCGSLVTYRQHANLLESAPRCLRDGCSQEKSNNTIASQCPATAPCSTYWNMFVHQFDHQHAWCSDCSSDLACRITGWPVMNATAMCESTPNQMLFGQGGCCSQGDEPFELAKWTGTMCNGSEWRAEFDDCGGMACLDWREWVMPWNWTVQNTALPPDQQDCTAPSKYLAVYAAEHFFWLLATFAVGFFRLRIARHEEAHERNVLRYLLIYVSTRVKFTQNRKEVLKEKLLPGEDLRPAVTDALKWGFPVIMGVFMAGLQLAFNFLVAGVMRRNQGYREVPLATLALLFCCRPRLSWLSCLLALFPKHWLVNWFKFKPDGDGLWAARLVLSSVAVSAAVTEAIMQLLGSYFLGTAANVARKRGFYANHHLRPMQWGRDAHRMYWGALCWLILCIPLVIIWFLVAFFFASIYHAVARWRKDIYRFLKRKENSIPLPRGRVEWLLDHINPNSDNSNDSAAADHASYDQPYEYYGDLPMQYTQATTFMDQPIPYGGPASGDLFTDQPMPIRRGNRRSQYSQLAQAEFTDQPLEVRHTNLHEHRVASAGYMTTPSAVQRRTASGGQYNSLGQIDNAEAENPFEDQPYAVPSPTPIRNEAMRPNHRDTSSASFLVKDASALSQASLASEHSSNKRSDYTDPVILKWQTWEKKIIFAGAFLGMLAYAAQWVFWDGFVKASGDRFCPPSILAAGGIWSGGAFICKCFKAGSYIEALIVTTDVGAPLMAY